MPACHSCKAGSILNDGVFSLWNGQHSQKSRPRCLTGPVSPMMATKSLASRTFWISSSLIAMDVTEPPPYSRVPDDGRANAKPFSFSAEVYRIEPMFPYGRSVRYNKRVTSRHAERKRHERTRIPAA